MKTIASLSLFAAALGAASVLHASSCCEVTAAPAAVAAGELPARSLYQFDAEFTDDSGAIRTLEDWRGHPVVVTLFFAHCGYACPMLTQNMKQIEEAVAPEVRANARFLLVSFDTERDTVEVLHAYREQHQLGDNWTLLRGPQRDIRTLAMLLGVQFRQEPSGDISHSNVITLLDRDGEIAHRREGLQGGLPAAAEALVRLSER